MALHQVAEEPAILAWICCNVGMRATAYSYAGVNRIRFKGFTHWLLFG